MGFVQTKCPYCGATNSYEWQECSLPHLGDTAFLAYPMNVVEVYCRQCQTTISITPVLPKN